MGETHFDPETCIRCTCEPSGTTNCINIPNCEPPDAGTEPDASVQPDQGFTGAADGSPNCSPLENRCLDERRAERCLPDGTLTVIECGETTRCVVDRCALPACEPGALFCVRGQRLHCGPDGYSFVNDDPCAPGEICADDGVCVNPQADVMLIVDTSSSMSRPVIEADPRPFPECEDPQAPHTRLGLVKLALRTLFQSDDALGLRLALQRFPQQPTATALCGPGHYEEDRLELDPDLRSLDADAFSALRARTLAVPFTRDGAPAIDALLRWTDFNERWGPLPDPCDTCPGLCIEGQCQGHLDPELRATGETPLGRSLFVAGETFRHEILREGRACVADADCQSPHYTCREGACHDPLYDCRPYVVVLFTDGAENFDPVDSFFHPVVQARRMNVGLHCEDDGDCLSPARCDANRCVVGRCEFDEGRGCQLDGDCENGPCLQDPPPPGGFGASPITHPGGRPAQLTVHVVDAVGGHIANRQTAWWGGGRYQQVQSLDVNGLLAALQPLLDTKGLVDRCVSAR